MVKEGGHRPPVKGRSCGYAALALPCMALVARAGAGAAFVARAGAALVARAGAGAALVARAGAGRSVLIVVLGIIRVAGVVAGVVTCVVDPFAIAVEVPIGVYIIENAARVIGRWRAARGRWRAAGGRW